MCVCVFISYPKQAHFPMLNLLNVYFSNRTLTFVTLVRKKKKWHVEKKNKKKSSSCLGSGRTEIDIFNTTHACASWNQCLLKCASREHHVKAHPALPYTASRSTHHRKKTLFWARPEILYLFSLPEYSVTSHSVTNQISFTTKDSSW